MQPQEHKECFASEVQRELLLSLAPQFKGFFLSGGTALSVFYLHHRVSDDLDFFTPGRLQGAEIRSVLGNSSSNLRVVTDSENYFSAIANGVKVEFVSTQHELGSPQSVQLDGAVVAIDTFENIFANKLTTLVSRGDTKDFVDFHFGTARTSLTKDELISLAIQKEVTFDDPAEAAYRIERNIGAARRRKDWPRMIVPFDQAECLLTATDWVNYLYEKGRKDAGL